MKPDQRSILEYKRIRRYQTVRIKLLTTTQTYRGLTTVVAHLKEAAVMKKKIAAIRSKNSVFCRLGIGQCETRSWAVYVAWFKRITITLTQCRLERYSVAAQGS
jgi:hypothetical protein